MSNKVFKAHYYISGFYGHYYTVDELVITNCKSAALGMLLTLYSNTDAKHWTIEELSLEKEAHYFINSYED